MAAVNSEIFEAVAEVITRRSFDRANSAVRLCMAMLEAEGAIRRDNEDLLAGNRVLNRDREILPRLSQATGLGYSIYLGNRRIASATVPDAGTAPELGGFAATELVDAVLRRREVFKGAIEYMGRQYIVVSRPLFSDGDQDFAPVGMIEAFQDKEAYLDLLTAAARAGIEDQMANLEERADGMEGIIRFIDDTARRLQLLALNGNIIAAQAGEHGRAFRVVCRELGSLAGQAKHTAGDVRKLITTMGLDRELENEFDFGEEPPLPSPTSRDSEPLAPPET